MASLVVSLGQIPPDNSKQQKSAAKYFVLICKLHDLQNPNKMILVRIRSILRSTYEKAEEE
jgi:hypothetical protein